MDATWQDQEKARMASLTQITAEIKATNKKKQSEIYQQLLDKQTFLAGATPMPTYPEKPVKEQLPPEEKKPLISDLSFLQSLAFNLLTPVFLWLRSRLPLIKKKGNSARTLPTTLINSDQNDAKKSDQSSDQSMQVLDKETPAKIAEFSCAFEAQAVPCDSRYGVTLEAIETHFSTTNRSARNLRADAFNKGLLVKERNKYFYPKKKSAKRTQKPVKAANVVQLKRVK